MELKTIDENSATRNIFAEMNDDSPVKTTSYVSKQVPVETTIYRSGSALLQSQNNGLSDITKADSSASSRSQTQGSNTGYSWQQYMPFGGGEWETKSSTPKTTIAANSNANTQNYANKLPESVSNAISVKKSDTSYETTTRPTEGRFDKTTVGQQPSRYSLNSGNVDALQRQSVISATSSGPNMSWRSSIGSSQANNDPTETSDSDSSEPSKEPAMPNTELGFPTKAALRDSLEGSTIKSSELNSFVT